MGAKARWRRISRERTVSDNHGGRGDEEIADADGAMVCREDVSSQGRNHLHAMLPREEEAPGVWAGVEVFMTTLPAALVESGGFGGFAVG